MNESVSIVSLAAGLALFLPSVSEAWDADPGDDAFRRKLRRGEVVYAAVVLAAAGLQSASSGSVAPALVALVAVAAVVGFLEHAYRDCATAAT